MVTSQNLHLEEGIEAFARHLAQRPLTSNTRKAFIGDVRIFARHLQAGAGGLQGHSPYLSDIHTEQIKSFLASQERGRVANSPKSLERRLTSLKVFFKWLQETGYIVVDPADSVAYKPFMDPLPEHLSEVETTAVIEAAKQVAMGERLDTRPLAVIMLVLETGIKKGECLALRIDDIERGEQGHASVWVRYPQKRLQFKNRQLAISDECLHTVETHIQRYDVKDKLFDCTGRNIEYIFNRKVAPLAGLQALTFEMLRWTCAVNDYRAGTFTAEQLQVRYGLSALGWLEMEAKLARLTQPAESTHEALNAN